MRTTARGLAVWTLTMALARVAAAQEPGPPPDEPPPSYEPPPVEVTPGTPPPPAGAPLPPAGAAPVAEASAGPILGGLGQIAISNDLHLSALHDSYSMSGGTATSRTTVRLEPALDYFVAPNVSIGGQLQIGFDSIDRGYGTTDDTTVFGLLPRVGYVVAFSPTTVLWPRAALGYIHQSAGNSSQTSTSSYRVPLQVFIPVIFQPIPHFFIGGGVLVSTDLISKIDDSNGNSVDTYKLTEIGLLSTVGGYFGGP